MSRGKMEDRSIQGPLAQVGQKLVEAAELAEAERMDGARRRARMAGRGSAMEALSRVIKDANANALVDCALPAIMRFDLHQVLRRASEQLPGDRGLKHAAHLTQKLWHDAPMGTVTVGQIADLRAHIMGAHSRSRCAAVINAEVPRCGFNTLPLPKLTRLAARLMDASEEEARSAFEAEGLAGSRPEQLRAQAYVRSLASLEPMTVRLRAPDVVERVGQAMGEVQGIPEEEEFAVGAEPMEPEEAPEQVAEVDSPNTGQPIEVSLKEAPMEPQRPPTGSSGLPDVESMDIVGQLEDFGEMEDADLGFGAMDDTEIVSGQESVVMPDPTSDGESDIRVTVETVEPELEQSEGMEPPGEPMDVAEPVEEAPEFTAASDACPKCGKSNSDCGCKMSRYHVWAYVDGHRGSTPMERLEAPSMGWVLRRIAEHGVAGQVACRLGDPEREAVVLIDEHNMLHVSKVSGETDAVFTPDVNAQQPDSMGGTEDGGAVLTEEKKLTDERATRSVPNVSKKSGLSRRTIEARCAAMGLDGRGVEDAVLDGKTVRAGVWSLRINDGDEVELHRAGGRVASKGTWSLVHLDTAVDEFMVRAAAGWKDPAVAEAEAASRWWGSTGNEGDVKGHAVSALFTMRCAMCNEESEYVLPSVATSLKCAACLKVADASAVERAFEAKRAALTGDYVVLTDVPGDDERARALNARRLLKAIQGVVGDADGGRNSAGQLEVLVPAAGKPELNRIERVLTGRYGVQVSAQAAESQQFSQTPPGSPMPPELSLAPGTGAPGAAVDGGSPGTSGGQSPVTLGTPPSPSVGAGAGAGAGVEVEAGVDGECGIMNPTSRVEPPPRSRVSRRRVGQGLPMGPPADVGPEMGPDLLGDGGDAGAGGMESAEGLAAPTVDEGSAITASQEEAIRGAMSLYRQSNVGPATAIAKFLGEHGALLDMFGDVNTPGRHQAEAKLLRIMGDAFSEPAIVMTADRKRQLVARLWAAFPRVAWEAPSVNTQQPDTVKVPGQPLGPDTSGNSAFDDPSVNTQVDTVAQQPGAKAPPSDGVLGNGQGDVEFGGPATATHDPAANAGVKLPSTKEFPGPDYATGSEGLAQMDEVSSAAPGALRSK